MPPSELTPTTMPYRRLGTSGLKVSRIILGCMSYGSNEWEPWALDYAAALEHIKFAYEAGINTFDTADVYSNGQSEEYLGRALKEIGAPRESVVVMTKIWCPIAPTYGGRPFERGDVDTLGYVNQHGLSRKHIFATVKKSLERLGTEYIDVLFCHRFDDETPIAETMEALHDIVKLGWVRHIGMSSCAAWQFHVMQNYAINHNLTPFIVMQNNHSALYREEEREMIPTLKHFGVTTVPWSPLARGLLARPLAQRDSTKRGAVDWMAPAFLRSPGSPVIIERVEEIAKKKGVSMSRVAIAWLLKQEIVSGTIIGTTKLENLKDLIDGLKVELSDEESKYIEEKYQVQETIS